MDVSVGVVRTPPCSYSLGPLRSEGGKGTKIEERIVREKMGKGERKRMEVVQAEVNFKTYETFCHLDSTVEFVIICIYCPLLCLSVIS